jgi:hemolysin III
MSDLDKKIRISEYSYAEELLNVLTHAAGSILSVIALIVLYIQADKHGTELHVISYVIFGCSLIALYLASTLYHTFSNTRFHKFFKKLDHIAIYFLIAGTYSPLMLVGIKDEAAVALLKVIWALVFISSVFTFSKYKILRQIAFANYLLMGWMVVIIYDKLLLHVPITSLYLLFIGGIFYTSGVIFYAWNRIPFNHSIWHMFVLGGSTSHFFSIYYLLV